MALDLHSSLTTFIHTHNRFTALWILSGTTWVSWYQKKHSPTHTYRGHQSSLICFIITFMLLQISSLACQNEVGSNPIQCDMQWYHNNGPYGHCHYTVQLQCNVTKHLQDSITVHTRHTEVLLHGTDDAPNWNLHWARESWNWPGSVAGIWNLRPAGLFSKQRPRPEL